MNTARAQAVFTQIQHFGSLRNVLLGGGLAYAISEEKYTHTPVAFIFPGIYVGYQAYKNREEVANFARTLSYKNRESIQ